MRGYPLVPGVIDVGHCPKKGVWHPGPSAACPECSPPPPPPPPPPPEPKQVIEVKVEVVIPFAHPGSDCLTGKRQFVSRKAALGSVSSLRRTYRRRTIHAFKCSWCLLWHTGNKDRGDASRNRKRR